eukprot:jgi/Mesvir1/22822/Mv20084-RA.1
MKAPFLLPIACVALLAAGFSYFPLVSAQPCAINSQCSDGLFCNGVELCVNGSCLAGTPPVCDDGVACTFDRCDEGLNRCVYEPRDRRCNDFVFCNGQERCDPTLGCVDGLPPNCDDGRRCTRDLCDENNNECAHPPIVGCGCTNNAECGAVGCCCGGLGCRRRPPGVPCDLVCANTRCDFQGGDATCACLKNCRGPFCDPAAGTDTCGTHGQCCCAAGTGGEQPSGNTLRENCVNCGADCGTGVNTCTGNFVPGRLSAVCSQQIQ